MFRLSVDAEPRSLSWGLKTRPSAPSEGERQTVLPFGSRLIEGIGDRCALGSPSFAYFSQRKEK
jgi:hypothetical protein